MQFAESPRRLLVERRMKLLAVLLMMLFAGRTKRLLAV